MSICSRFSCVLPTWWCICHPHCCLLIFICLPAVIFTCYLLPPNEWSLQWNMTCLWLVSVDYAAARCMGTPASRYRMDYTELLRMAADSKNTVITAVDVSSPWLLNFGDLRFQVYSALYRCSPVFHDNILWALLLTQYKPSWAALLLRRQSGLEYIWVSCIIW